MAFRTNNTGTVPTPTPAPAPAPAPVKAQPVAAKAKVDDDLVKDPNASAATTAANKAYIPFNGVKVDGNIKDGSGTAGSFLKSVGFDPEPNPMGDLLQPTYHFSFYLDTDIEANQGGKNVFVIAETGLTGMNLQDVEIETFVGPNVRTRNATATSISIKIFEPFGAQLPDLLFQAAARMNIANYLKAPWFLKLKLHGYDEDGKVVQVGGEWIWKMVLIDIASQISEQGSMHTITAMPMAEVALNNQFCMLPSSVNADGTTVGEALQNIIKSMNDNIIQTYGATNPPFVQFEIKDIPYPYDTKVGVARPFDHKIIADQAQDSTQRANSDYGVQTSQFGPGTDIPAVVDKLMARTDTAIQIARVSREKPTTGPDLETTVRDPASFMHRVDTQVEYLGYDAVLGDYAKKITYVVKPFQSMRILTSMGRAMSFDKEKTLNKQKAQHAVQRAFLKKQYDYLFTGLNTEIEKFDINVNFRWAVAVPVMQNWSEVAGTAARVDAAALAQDATMKTQQSSAALENLKSQRIQLTEQISKEKAANPDAAENPTTAAALKKLNDDISVADQQNQQLRTIAGQARDQVNAAAAAALDKRRKANPTDRRIIDGEDDVYENTQSTDFSGAGGGNSSFLPITIVQDPDAPIATVRTGTGNDNNPNKSVYGAFLNQLYGSFDGNLQNLELDVRGDPYWLGPGNNGKIYEEDSNGTTPNWMNGEHIFVFRFKLPQGYDTATGTVSVAKDDTGKGGASGADGEQKTAGGGNSNIFTGFYATTTVTNHFREGRFTQTLSGVRIQGWSYENIIEGREVTVDDLTNYSNSNAPVDTGGVNSSAGSGTGRTAGAGNTRGVAVSSGGLTDQQILAATLMAEAGGEGARGMQAVGNVIVNRTKANYRGDSTVSEVILSPRQFSAWNNASPRSFIAAKGGTSTYATAYDIAGEILNGQSSDITGGATSYLNVPLTAKINGGKLPSWYQPSKVTTKIGKHTFLKGV